MIGTGKSTQVQANATIKVMPVKVDPTRIREFKSFEAFYKWLSKHHDKDYEVWIKVHKLGSGLPSINPKDAIDAALCWGWIDGLRKVSTTRVSYSVIPGAGRKASGVRSMCRTSLAS